MKPPTFVIYFQSAPTNPTDQQLAQATVRHQNKLTTAATVNQKYRRLEQELESASIGAIRCRTF